MPGSLITVLREAQEVVGYFPPPLLDRIAEGAVAETLRPFAYQGSVVLQQLGDETTADPDALEPFVTVIIYVTEDNDTPELRHRIEEILYHLGRLYPIPEPVFRELADEAGSCRIRSS